MNKNEIISTLKILDLKTTVNWVIRDARDEFYTDVILFRDLINIEINDDFYKWVSALETFEFIPDKVPKKGGLLRDSIWLLPEIRLIYAGILHYLLPKIDAKIPNQIYSYRLDTEDHSQYPFEYSMQRWKWCQNDFISDCLDEKITAVLLTDLTSYYDHINIETLIETLVDIIGPAINDDDKSVLLLLKTLLLHWSNSGYGIPQNIDTSSFLGSIYLYHIDKEIVEQRFNYYRWVDDIKICAFNENQAIRALHKLQDCLGKNRLFISSQKTAIIDKHANKELWDKMLDVTDDILISDLEIATDSENHRKVRSLIPRAIKLFQQNKGKDGDDKKFRAITGRLLDTFNIYGDIKEKYESLIVDALIEKMEDSPEKMSTWCDMLSGINNEKILHQIKNLLIEKPSVFNWHRYHLIRLLVNLNLEGHFNTFQSMLKTTARRGISLHESYMAIICLGQNMDDAERNKLFDTFFRRQSSILIRRAALIAIYWMEPSARNALYDKAEKLQPSFSPLITYLKNNSTCLTIKKPWSSKKPNNKPTMKKHYKKNGIGMSKGKIVHYSLSKRDSFYD
ncbi:RNA-directed DNA polymerase [Aeromonas veronii]|uniref:RNA-directed DNA polymerase n=1 Tax=Aeromonas veronii TaxID=654 RepID=UPI0038D34770